MGKCKSKPQRDIASHKLGWLLSKSQQTTSVEEGVEDWGRVDSSLCEKDKFIICKNAHAILICIYREAQINRSNR